MERGIYTSRFRAQINDPKCPGYPQSIIPPINVFTNLDLELKLNKRGNIVYKDEETRKIEMEPDQDKFIFQGEQFTIDESSLDLGQGKITIERNN